MAYVLIRESQWAQQKILDLSIYMQKAFLFFIFLNKDSPYLESKGNPIYGYNFIELKYHIYNSKILEMFNSKQSFKLNTLQAQWPTPPTRGSYPLLPT